MVFPGTDLPAGTILIDAIAGHVGIAESLRGGGGFRER